MFRIRKDKGKGADWKYEHDHIDRLIRFYHHLFIRPDAEVFASFRQDRHRAACNRFVDAGAVECFWQLVRIACANQSIHRLGKQRARDFRRRVARFDSLAHFGVNVYTPLV